MIRVNYDSTRAAAQQLSSAAELCRQMTAAANQLNMRIPACWEGDSAQAFSAEISEWIRKNRAIEKELSLLASDIRRIADEFEAAEKRIKQGLAGEVLEGLSEIGGNLGDLGFGGGSSGK